MTEGSVVFDRSNFFGRSGLQHELFKQLLKCFGRIGTKSRVYFRTLQHRAAGSSEPAKTFGHTKLADRPAVRLAGTNALKSEQVFLYFAHINIV